MLCNGSINWAYIFWEHPAGASKICCKKYFQNLNLDLIFWKWHKGLSSKFLGIICVCQSPSATPQKSSTSHMVWFTDAMCTKNFKCNLFPIKALNENFNLVIIPKSAHTSREAKKSKIQECHEKCLWYVTLTFKKTFLKVFSLFYPTI